MLILFILNVIIILSRHYAECHFVECQYAEFKLGVSVLMLSEWIAEYHRVKR
jgi:hypothetical protein